MGFTATFSTLIYIKIRSLLTINFDANTAGLWDGMLKISGGYLAVITSAISLYYLPKLSSIKKEKEIKKEIFNGFKVLLPLMFIISFSLFLFKRPIISLFFSSEYINMSDFFFPQLLGDFIRITSQCIAYLMIAKAMTKLFIYTEIYFAIQYLILVWLCIDHFGLIGVFWAYTINSFIYLIFLIFKFKKYLI